MESAAAHRRLPYEAKSGSRSGLVRRPTATLGPEGVQRVIRHRLSHDRVGQRPRPTPSCPQRNARPGQGLQLSLATRASLGASLGAIKFFFAVFTPPPPGCDGRRPLEIRNPWRLWESGCIFRSQPRASADSTRSVIGIEKPTKIMPTMDECWPAYEQKMKVCRAPRVPYGLRESPSSAA